MQSVLVAGAHWSHREWLPNTFHSALLGLQEAYRWFIPPRSLLRMRLLKGVSEQPRRHRVRPHAGPPPAHHARRGIGLAADSHEGTARVLSVRSFLCCRARPGAVVDEKLHDALGLRCARSVERGAAVAVRGIEIDPLLRRERHGLEHEPFTVSTIRLHPRRASTQPGGGHQAGGHLRGRRCDSWRGARMWRWRHSLAVGA